MTNDSIVDMTTEIAMNRISEELAALVQAHVEQQALDLRLQKDQLRPTVKALVIELLPEVLFDMRLELVNLISRELVKGIQNQTQARIRIKNDLRDRGGNDRQ